MNETITYAVLQAAVDCGVREFIICPGIRNVSFIDFLRVEERISTFYWPEERSASFFALGRSRQMRRPVAVVTTSGTAAGELLPAAMEAYYSGVPLLLITADRPRRFRGSGAPQTAQQAGIFGEYARVFMDIHGGHHTVDLSKWNQRGPAHINVCLEEPQGQIPFSGKKLIFDVPYTVKMPSNFYQSNEMLNRFLSQIEHPLAIVSTLQAVDKEETINFLLKLNIPVLLEAISGLREEPRLQHLRIRRVDKILESANSNGYAIDGVLRIGGIPTHRIWRDIENLKNSIKVCSISELSLSGLSWNRNIICVNLTGFFKAYVPPSFDSNACQQWLRTEIVFESRLLELFEEEPASEPSLLHALSTSLPDHSHVYLGNSLPIREWDLAANKNNHGFVVSASRGLNGIDGQISTFLGLCVPERENWAIVGDLTALYDMVAFWILPQLKAQSVSVVIVNNGGGQIFNRIMPQEEMLNSHSLTFKALASMWDLKYTCWQGTPQELDNEKRRLLEIIPNEAATKRLWKKIDLLHQLIHH